jgi:putative membrane protein
MQAGLVRPDADVFLASCGKTTRCAVFAHRSHGSPADFRQEVCIMRSKSLLVGLFSGALSACGGQATLPPQPIARTSIAPAATSVGSQAVKGSEAPSGPASRSNMATTTAMVSGRAAQSGDEEVAAVRIAMHDGQIVQGKLAEEKAVNLRVRDFASTLASRHAVAKERQAEILDRLAMKPVESASSEAVRAEAQETLESLKALSGAAFDDAFLDAEVDQQNKMLDAVGNHLIPNTQNPDLKADLVRLVPQFVVSVREVTEIRRDLAAGPEMPEDYAYTQKVWR